MGTADEFSMDILINSLTTVSKEYGAAFADWAPAAAMLTAALPSIMTIACICCIMQIAPPARAMAAPMAWACGLGTDA